MGQKRRARGEPRYYSERLIKKLDYLRTVPTTIVEAPPGHGKTTAIRDYLETHVPESVPVYWLTATDELPAACFKRLSRLVFGIDSRAGERLMRIELPNAVTVGEACDALRSIRCDHEAYLVIDNFQLLYTALPASFFVALIEHGGADLHVILITHILKRNVRKAVLGQGFLHVTAADLRLNAGDIQRYYALAGVDITNREARNVASSTGGWIIAVYLQLRTFRERGAFADTSDILTLMDYLIWSRLTGEQQAFLLSMSPLETATTRQLCVLAGCDALPGYALEALENPFIRYDTAERRYEPHSLFRHLMDLKREERGAAFSRACLLRAGDLCRDDGKAVEALWYYRRIGDYERMLSLNLSPLILEDIGGRPFSELALDIARDCPAPIKARYPLSMLRVAWALLSAGLRDAFDVLMKEQRGLPALSEQPALLGEWLLLSSYQRYPDLSEMTAVLKQAAALFKGKVSQVILPDAPWWFGSHTALGEFNVTPGAANREADALEAFIGLYAKLTGGHGAGADVLFRAELAYQRGDIGNAEILAYKAVFLAESKKQSVVQLGATMILAHLALHNADMASWQQAISAMERAASYAPQNTLLIRSLLDIIRGVLFNELQNQKRVAGWLRTGAFLNRPLPPPMIENALFTHLSYLMHEGEFARLTGTAEAQPPRQRGPFRDTLRLLTVAVGQMGMGNPEEAAAIVRFAAQRGLPDALILPFAAYSTILGKMVDDLIETEYPHLYGAFCACRERFLAGWTTLHSAMFPAELPPDLTAREYEVARLAAEGLNNNEIAEKLLVTESTVRTHLRAVFRKLDIDRRARLAEKLR